MTCPCYRRAQKARGWEAPGLYLIASKCGTRPSQIRSVRRSNVTPEVDAWVFAKHKTAKKTKKQLVVAMPPCVATLTRILLHRSKGDDLLFKQLSGAPWKKDTVARRLNRLRKRIGISDSYIAYAFRHTFATEALLAGNHVATVATMLGHVDGRMVTKVYGHLDQHRGHLIDAAAKTAARRFKS